METSGQVPTMSPEREERIYRDVLRDVIWGRERVEVFGMLTVNGLTGDAAEAIYERARAERIALLRSEGVRRAVKGALLLAAGIGLFCFLWFGLGFITRLTAAICVFLAGWGIWRLVDGVAEIIMAPMRKGSATPD